MYCAHSTGAFHSNGYSTRTSGLTKALVGLGTDIVVAARPGYPWDVRTSHKPKTQSRFESTVDDVKTVYNPGTSWSRLALDEYIHEAADIYAREAMINRPSRIVAASNHVTALPALIAARRLGVPFAYEVRGLWEVTEASGTEGYDQSDRYALAVQLETLVATEADHVFAITTQVRDELVRRGVDVSKISLLPNAAYIYEFSPLRPDPALAAKHRLQDGLTIGYAGSVLDYEGLDLVIEAIAQLHADGVAAKLVIVGDGPALKGLKELTRELEVSHLVEFIGRVPAKSVPRFIEIFDVVVCPRVSSVVTEMVSPLKPLEAMSAGKTVIGSNVAPLVDLLGTEGTRGMLFKAGDSADLARVITNVSQDRALREQIGREARQWICKNRSWERIARDQLSGLGQIAVPKTGARDKALSGVTIALISDEFTRTSIGNDVTLVMPTPHNWKALLEEKPVDVLLVESAWEGNDGEWHRKIGYYDDEECTDLRELLAYCASRDIPTVFWNKEDPVHFNRFRTTASFFDHVFTTDANCLKDYWAHRGPRLKTMASLPFWAQPALHNPLSTGEEQDHSVAYGGSYYGQRFAKRSQELVTLLDAAIPHGLKIYDRQFDNPDSPYRFPEHLQEFVQGGLPYAEMVKAYKNHAVHINVNSVSDSPTMFSRRVFELAGCGTPCVSGPGLEHGGIFGITDATSFTKASVAAKLDRWMTDEYTRLRDAQDAMRIVYRSHLSIHRLAYLLRTAGIPVAAQGLPSYVLQLAELDHRTAELVLGQSHPPLAVVTRAVPSAEILAMFAAHHVEVLKAIPNDPELFVADFTESFEDPLAAEDLATAIRHTHANAARINVADFVAYPMPLWDWSSNASKAINMHRVGHDQDPAIGVLQLPSPAQVDEVPDQLFSLREGEPRNVLIAGHDLKFAGAIIEGLKSAGHNVTVDQWTGHSQHDEAKSRELLVDADVIFCEWSLGNLAWYSKNKLPDQRLVSRFHFQEIITKYPAEVDYANVDELIFVGEYLRRTAITKFGIPENLTKVVFNTVDVTGLDRPKTADARFNLGLVGMVPEHKRLDVALDLVAKLRSTDSRYHLYIKGNRPEEYSWMAARPQEMKFYEEQYTRIETDPLLRDGVTFDGHGSDMQDWYQKIGVSLSVSDFESFHYTIADGAASGAVPMSLAWAGADQIYPAHWLANSVADMAERIIASTASESMFHASGTDAQNFAKSAFSKPNTEDILIANIVG
ncbi:glycosyltransferase [Paeniglutamicibacter antarcticus]|uniref:D-inositol 3-phosphate glycosyltransferase n=1 Tax=Paeniglutamicibacter antarcticus TaxID=494023 RepID=A0ABP9TMC9_9MICC